LLFLAIIAACTIPFFAYLLGFGEVKDSTVFTLLSSFMVRVEHFWPDAWDQLINKGNLILGRGMGGIGVPQMFFEPHEYNSVDNIFIYAYIYFGIFSLIYFYYIYVKSKVLNYHNDLCYYLILLTVFIYGTIQSIFESVILNFFFGMALGYITENKKITQLKPMELPVPLSRAPAASQS
jgi:hypothetical protein